jgi:hypothetical protein
MAEQMGAYYITQGLTPGLTAYRQKGAIVPHSLKGNEMLLSMHPDRAPTAGFVPI